MNETSKDTSPVGLSIDSDVPDGPLNLNPIPRAREILDRETFRKLKHLHDVQTWLEDHQEELFDLWDSCETSSQRDLIFKLLIRFKYLSSREAHRCGAATVDHITGSWNLLPSNTRIVATSDRADSDGSQAFLYGLKQHFASIEGWTEKHLINSIRGGVDAARDGMCIVLLDDFIGTGSTMLKRVKWFEEEINKKQIDNITIYICGLAAMERAKLILDEMDRPYFVPIWMTRGISDFFKGEELKIAVADMKALEGGLLHKFNGEFLPRFGYKRSEALYCQEPGTAPNNVFPIFWWGRTKKKTRRRPLLQRLR